MRTTIVAFASFLIFSGICSGQTQDTAPNQPKNKVSFGLELRWFYLDFRPRPVEVGNIPDSMRQVPVHKDDGYLGRKGEIVTIPADIIKPGLFVGYSPAIAPEISVGRFKTRGGISLNIPFYPKAVRGNGGSTRERHQYDSGTSRGTGTSLVYYAVNVSSKPTLGWLGEAEFIANDNWSFLAGYAISEYKLQIATGWDRFNDLQTYRKYDISHNQVEKRYVGFRIKPEDESGSGLVMVGVYSQKTTPTAAGQALNMRNGNSFFVAVAVSTTLGRR